MRPCFTASSSSAQRAKRNRCNSPEGCRKLAPPGRKRCEDHKPGRSGNLVAERNELILRRFVYWGSVSAHRHDWVIDQLCREFFLTQRTVCAIIESHREAISALRIERDIRSWREAYRHLKW
jgi:hypothetical protein